MIGALALATLALAAAPVGGDDLRLAADHLRNDHPNLFHDLSSERFDAAVADLESRAGSLSDDELLVGLMRLAALPGVRDGHTGIFPLNPGNARVLHAYPLRLYTFADGTYVVAQAGGSDLLRAKLIAVNGRALNEVFSALMPLVPRDNQSTLALRLTTFLNTPEALHVGPKPLAVKPPRFTYDRKRPLALKLGKAVTADGIVRRSLTFDAGRGRKGGFWTHPAGGAPWPVVLFSPGSGGTASSQLPDADRLARRGVASLTVTPPVAPLTCRAAADVHSYVNYVVGRRRALDLLAKLPGADRRRVAAVGFSLGAAVTATLVGIDHRLRGAAIQSSRAHLSTYLGSYCRSAAYRRAYSVLDPVRYVPRAAPTWLLFQNGRRDPISPGTDVDALVAAASAPKEQRWYDAGHELNDQARADLDEWLVKLLS
jgi:dienelactone hydrolase